MIRKDGTFVIYKIQHTSTLEHGPSAWTMSNLDCFGTPKGFGSSDRCWQETGVYGTFNLRQAKAGAKWLDKKNKWRVGFNFRVVKVEITQKTTPVKE